jgi:acyl phosphate:glycerol-3-phosphate acyltransferase
MNITETLALVLAYFLGSIPFGHIIVKLKTGKDVRESGSGATGATNVLRTAGKTLGILTFALDIVKGVVAVLLARWITGVGSGDTTWVVAGAAILAIIGHIFPVWLGFKAGKGVATGLGVFLAIAPVAALCAFAIFIGIVAKTRYISLGSIIGSVIMIPLIWFWNGWVWPSPYLTQMLVAITIVAAVIVFKHRENIQRLMSGTENKFGQKKVVAN